MVDPTEAVSSDTKPKRRRAARDNVIREMPLPESSRVAPPPAERQVNERASALVTASREMRIPESVRAHFVQVGERYYFADGARAFTDGRTRLSTPSENTQLIADLIGIAQTRGWQRIAVSGSERFRRHAWQQAREAGLEVRGYRPSRFEHERLRQRLEAAHESPARAVRKQRGRRDAESETSSIASQSSGVAEPGAEGRGNTGIREHQGRLLEHGPAPYQHDPHAPMSYVAKLTTRRGEVEVWGVDLLRAFKESLSKPQTGDEVVLRALRVEPVTVRRRERDAEGSEHVRAQQAQKVRWLAEKTEFLERREQAAQVLRDPEVSAQRARREHPELLGAFLQVHAAELAAKRFRDVADRERFVALVRGALADSVARGEPLPAVRLRESAARSRDAADARAQGRGRE
jgi:putative DNA primase/helicase